MILNIALASMLGFMPSQYATNQTAQQTTIEEAFQSSMPSCESIVERLKNNKSSDSEIKILRYAFESTSVKDDLDSLRLEGMKFRGHYDRFAGEHDLFYKDPQSKREWDAVLVLRDGNVPAELYVARGDIDSEYSTLVPHDFIISFYQNPLSPYDNNFNMENLKMYARKVVRTCASDRRILLEEQFKKKNPIK